MNICEYSRSMSFLDLGPRSFTYKKIKLAFLRNLWAITNKIVYVSLQVQGNEYSLTWCWSHDQDGCNAHIWWKKTTLKSSFHEPVGRISTKLGMTYRRLNPIIMCSNDKPGVTLTYFTASSKFATKVIIWKTVTIMDSLEIIAFCDMDFGLYRKPDD